MDALCLLLGGRLLDDRLVVHRNKAGAREVLLGPVQVTWVSLAILIVIVIHHHHHSGEGCLPTPRRRWHCISDLCLHFLYITTPSTSRRDVVSLNERFVYIFLAVLASVAAYGVQQILRARQVLSFPIETVSALGLPSASHSEDGFSRQDFAALSPTCIPPDPDTGPLAISTGVTDQDCTHPRPLLEHHLARRLPPLQTLFPAFHHLPSSWRTDAAVSRRPSEGAARSKPALRTGRTVRALRFHLT